jgi:hypothetical protein
LTSDPGKAADSSPHTSFSNLIQYCTNIRIHITMGDNKKLSALVLIADGSEEMETVTPLE